MGCACNGEVFWRSVLEFPPGALVQTAKTCAKTICKPFWEQARSSLVVQQLNHTGAPTPGRPGALGSDKG